MEKPPPVNSFYSQTNSTFCQAAERFQPFGYPANRRLSHFFIPVQRHHHPLFFLPLFLSSVSADYALQVPTYQPTNYRPAGGVKLSNPAEKA